MEFVFAIAGLGKYHVHAGRHDLIGALDNIGLAI